MNDIKANDKSQPLPDADVLLASIYFLMTRYVRLPDRKVSKAIVEHLEKLALHPDCESEVLKKAGKRLALQWRDYIEGRESPSGFYLQEQKSMTSNNIH